MKKLFFITCIISFQKISAQQSIAKPSLFVYDNVSLQQNTDTITVQPLQKLALTNAKGSNIKVFDGDGREYFSSPTKLIIHFIVGGSLGKQTIWIYNQNKIIDSLSFYVDAKTNIDDGGYYKKMFTLFYNGMFADSKKGTFPIEWNGKTYHVFVPWILDNYQTMKGMKYFMPNGAELIDIMRQSQRDDGMIYSYIQYQHNVDYFLTRDKFSGYSKKIGDKVFVRQPVENHPEYLYVNTIYAVWKSDGNEAWMKKNLESAERALDYAPNDPARWSKRFGLLKRVYTIDSWDFAVEDEYMPNIGITNTMIIDPNKSKFGVFFGDNTGYIQACYNLAAMLNATGDSAKAMKYKQRADEMSERLNKLAWNRKFFTHFIDEDSSVHRHLGVDEKSQIAQSNAYSINRDITHEQSKAIIETYLNLKNHLPVGSPGEWYAIYPPFQKGFGAHDDIWQYMNGGVGGHVAGELARGAYANGFENYGTDILNRVFELGKKYDNKIYFSYTGSIPPPPPAPVYKTVDISAYANMDLSNTNSAANHKWMNGGKPGDDFHNLPVGEQIFDSIKFNVIDPAKNNRNAVVAVSNQKDFPGSTSVPVNDTAACIYLLNTASKPASENVAGIVKFMYEDGSSYLQYIIMGKQLAYWWFTELKTETSGVAWYGKNDVSEGIGVSWCAVDNPHPQKKITSIVLQSSQNNNIYAVLGITLSNEKHYVPVSPVSYGGPDDWAAATNMDAMIEGLAGVKNSEKSEAFEAPIISPKWITTKSDTVSTTVRFAASKGYVAYHFINDEKQHSIHLTATTGGNKMLFHILLPEHTRVASVNSNNKNISFKQSISEQSSYVDFEMIADKVKYILVNYE
ncbi:MAG: hypothetical protein ABI472_17450 [Ginsengibacter sp.]